MPYTVGPGFFIKVLLAKKYALPTQVINALVNFFLNFAEGNKGLVEAMEDSGDEMDELINDGSELPEGKNLLRLLRLLDLLDLLHLLRLLDLLHLLRLLLARTSVPLPNLKCSTPP